MKPSVSRNVHYVSYGTPGGEYRGECRAAVVTQVHGYADKVEAINGDGKIISVSYDPVDPHNTAMVGLCVLNPMGQFFKTEVRFSEGKEPGTWHWPERVEGSTWSPAA